MIDIEGAANEGGGRLDQVGDIGVAKRKQPPQPRIIIAGALREGMKRRRAFDDPTGRAADRIDNENRALRGADTAQLGCHGAIVTCPPFDRSGSAKRRVPTSTRAARATPFSVTLGSGADQP